MRKELRTVGLVGLIAGASLVSPLQDASATNSGTTLLAIPIEPSSSILGTSPPVSVFNDGFTTDEAGPCPSTPWDTVYCSYSALDDTFTGPSAISSVSTRDQFRTAIAPYLNPSSITYSSPLCNPTTSYGAPLQLFTHTKAYQIHQSSFVTMYSSYGNKGDFLPPGARQMNSYMGDQSCPLVSAFSSSLLPQTLGSLAYLNANNVVLMTDNRYNPWRWAAPINEIHHHEQASLSFLTNSTSTGAADSAVALAASLNGSPHQRLLLQYDLDLTVDDYRKQMNEYQFTDMAGVAANGTDLFSRTASDTAAYIAQGYPGDLETEQMAQYFSVRYSRPSIQISVAVNFQQDGVLWREIEFMVAGKDYTPSYTPAFAPVSDPKWFPYIPEGGNNGPVAWARLRVDGLKQSLVNSTNPALMPLRSGASYFSIPDGHSFQHLSGTIDLTDYYRYAISTRTFPGTSGAWNGAAVSSINPETGSLVAGEHHQINWIGVIYENHGPYAVKVQINRLDVQLVDDVNNASPFSNYQTPVVGNIDTTTVQEQSDQILGWACALGRADPVRVNAYVGGPYPIGELVGFADAGMPSEPGVDVACQDSSLAPHRFQILLSQEISSAEQGQSVFVYGISPSTGASVLIGSSGTATLPYIDKQSFEPAQPTQSDSLVRAFSAPTTPSEGANGAKSRPRAVAESSLASPMDRPIFRHRIDSVERLRLSS